MRSAADARAPRSTELSVAKKSLMPEMLRISLIPYTQFGVFEQTPSEAA